MENRYLYRGKRIDNGEWAKGNLIRSNDAEVGYEAIIIPTNDSNMYTNCLAALMRKLFQAKKISRI